MPIIQFDVLVSDDAAGRQVEEAFARAVGILVEKQMLIDGRVTRDSSPTVEADVVAQLREVYERDRGEDPDNARVHRYLIEADGASSYNQLAMGLSRILTPKAELPNDPVQLERQETFEQPSIFPWTVEIIR
ncbi:hypothetical protein [Corynebacterium aquatimens]|uniref:Uncharacterized protein n=1 Tax=Corynebacterium aquatimens TaxID=1190508 RepID=A0A931E3N5_9CORY|nr:hypothetical protein [Corynebacterium aquatimens]MBG6121908.1 hypothetical protein [Corynebacterium aquatimens]WJY65554.1 hypothetical protein CAQUA_04205 [Corynebacterium aquatimens]